MTYFIVLIIAACVVVFKVYVTCAIVFEAPVNAVV